MRIELTTPGLPLVNIVTTYPLELVCIDYLTLEPAKGVGNVLVITDHFTKYVLAIATKNQTANTTAEVFHDEFITHFGIPTHIHSDQGAYFESDIIRELSKITGMTKSQTTPYHPMGNPIPERFNRTLLNMLGTLEPEKKSDWKKNLPSLTYAHNCTKHETTKVSPHELMFRRKPRLPIDAIFDTPVQEVSQTTKEYVEQLKKRMKTAQEIGQEVTEKARSKMRSVYDRKAKSPRIQIGDKVLVKILKFDGKHKIEDRYANDIYTVVGQPNIQIPVFDVRNMNGTKKRLYRNHLFLLGFIDNKSEDEDKNGGDDDQQKDDSDRHHKADRIDKDKEKSNTANEDQSKGPDPDLQKDSKKDGQMEERAQTEVHCSDDEDDLEIEFVTLTHPTGDAWTSGLHSSPIKGPVIPKEKIVEKKTEEKGKEKKIEKKVKEKEAENDKGMMSKVTGTDTTKRKVVHTAADEEETDLHTDKIEETDPHVDEKEETHSDDIETDPQTNEAEEADLHVDENKEVESHEAEAEEEKGAVGDPLPRRSTREKKIPKKYDSYIMHQVTSRPIDRRLQTLQSLLGSGVFNELDTYMTNSILDAVMKYVSF